jgi:hypothetical protein
MARDRLPRWEGDLRGSGSADGRAFAVGIDALKAAMVVEGWVAEDPDIHLLPQIVKQVGRPGSQLRLRHAVESDGLLLVDLEAPRDTTPAEIRRAVFVVIGRIAEQATFVRESSTSEAAESRVYDLLTGSLDGDSPFAGHGHMVRFRVARGDEI